MTRPKTAANLDPATPMSVAPPIPERRRRSTCKAASEPAPARTRKSTKASTTAKPAAPVVVANPTKRDQLADLLLRDEGATIDQMIALTGWLPHTVRAAMSGLRKAGYGIDSDKVDGVRTYRAVAPR